MPYVNIRITRDGTTPAQKQRLIEGTTQLLKDVLDKDPGATFVVIDEVATEDWGWKGKTVKALREEPQS